MNEHELKTWPEYFEAIRSGLKTFEVRKNDRWFAVGDRLLLREWEPGPNGCFTGRAMTVKVTYLLGGPFEGLKPGYVAMGIERLAI